MDFNSWLTRQVDRDDEVGLLARFAGSGVDDWPWGCRVRLSALRAYLRWCLDCCPDIADRLDEALVTARTEWRAERWPNRAAA